MKTDDINLSLSKLFYLSRLAIQTVSALTIIIIYKIINHYSNRKSDALFISLLFIYSTGFISASNRIESGMIAVFFLLLSFLFFIKFLKYKNNKNIIYFIASLLLIFSSIMQKKLVYFPLPFLFISSIIFLKKNYVVYFRYDIFNLKNLHNYILLTVYTFVFIYFYLKTIDNNTSLASRDLDFIFLSFNFIIINLILFFYIKFFQFNKYQNLLTYNLVFLSTYIFYKYFLIFLFSVDPEIWTISFTNYFGHINMFTSNAEIKDAHSFSTINLYLHDFINNLSIVINKYLLSLTYQSVLVWFSILLILNFFKKISLQKKIVTIFLFSGFFVIQSIILFRYEQDTYFLNSEFLLIFLISLLLSNIKKKFYYFVFITLLISSSFFTNIEKINTIKKNNLFSYCYVFKNFESVDGFYKFYTNKIPKNIRKTFCKDRLI